MSASSSGVPAICFTHHGGAYRIRWWAEGVVMAGFVPVVIDDGHDPLPAPARGWLAEQGIEYHATRWPRRGNLNGTDVAAAICEELALAAARHGSDYAIKIDDDTVIVDPGIFEASTAAAVGLTWKGDPRGAGAYGMAYALRIDVATMAALHLRRLPCDPRAPEDLTVWAAVRAIAGADEQVEHEFQAEGGAFCALPADADPAEAAELFGVLTVGNEPAGGWDNKAIETGVRMRQVIAAVRAKQEREEGAKGPAEAA